MSDRERRTIFIGAIAAALIVGAWAFLARSSPDSAGGGPEATDVYGRFEALAAQKQATRAALERARAQEARLAERLLDPADPAAAGATLAMLVEETARRSGVRIDQQLLGEPEEKAGALLALPLRLTLSMDVLGLRQFLYELARSEKTLVVDGVTIASLVAGGGGEPAGMPALQVQMTVKGYVAAPVEETSPVEGEAP